MSLNKHYLVQSLKIDQFWFLHHFDFYLDHKYRINSKLKNYDKLKKIEAILKRKFTYLENNMLEREKNIFDYII